MAKPQKHPALAEDGPLGGDLTLTVSDQDSEGRWPSPVVWTTGPNERHVYVLSRISLTPVEVPTYRFERTLDSGEQDPHRAGFTRRTARLDPATRRTRNLSTSQATLKQGQIAATM
jgi:hypothetical protein